MADTGPMTDDEILTYVTEQERISIGHNTDDVTEEQEEALRRYLGYPYGDEEEGRSQVVSMDAAQVVDWALPDLLEPFVSGNRVVEFRPTKREEEKDAENATRYIDHLFWIENAGFEILHSAAKDGLVQKLGVTKLMWDESERSVEQTYTGQSSVNLAIFDQDEEVEVLNVESDPVMMSATDALAAQQGQIPPILQAFPDGRVYTVKIRRTEKDGRIGLMGVPPEGFRISARAGTDEPPQYVAHTDRKTKAELIEMGFDEGKVREAADIAYEQDDGSDVRFYNQPHTDVQGPEFDWRMQKRWLHEEYIRLDADRDGDQEILQVFRVGNTLLSREEVTCDPFACFTPYPMPHSAIGQGMVDKVRQTQRVKTVLTRQMLDNVYLANKPQREVPEDAVTEDGATYDDLLNPNVGGVVRTKKPGLLREIGVPDRSATALSALEYMNQVRELDTGVVRAPIGLNAEAIDKDMSATEAAQIDRGSQKRDKLMARVFAEMYLAPLFRKMLRFVQQYQDKPREIRLSGEWIEMDPRTWNTEMYVIPSVGLGHENRDAQAAAANVIATFQEKAATIGMAGPEHFWQTAKDLVSALGKQFPEKYFVDPTSDAGKQALAEFQQRQAQQSEGADPRLLEAQQRSEIRLLEVQQKAQIDQLKLQADTELRFAEIEAKTATDREKAEADLILKREKIVGELAAAQDRMIGEFTLAREKLIAEIGLKREEIAVEAELARDANQARINGSGGLGGAVRFGGEIG